METTISLDEFSRVALHVAKVLEASRIEGSEKLLKLSVDAGDKDSTGLSISRQVIAGIGRAYEPEALVGKEIIIIKNLEPRMMMGQESQGMLLAATNSEGLPVILIPEREVEPGAKIR